MFDVKIDCANQTLHGSSVFIWDGAVLHMSRIEIAFLSKGIESVHILEERCVA